MVRNSTSTSTSDPRPRRPPPRAPGRIDRQPAKADLDDSTDDRYPYLVVDGEDVRYVRLETIDAVRAHLERERSGDETIVYEPELGPRPDADDFE